MATSVDEPLRQWIDAAAAKQPAPGGGSVSAVVGALAAAMGEMTLHYTAGKKSAAGHDDELDAAVSKFAELRGSLLTLAMEDQAAFEAYQAAETDEQKQAATDACLAVPTAISETAQDILTVAADVAGFASKWLLSDLAICGELALATVRCSRHNIEVNLGSLDAIQADRRRSACVQANAESAARLEALLATIATRRA